MDAVLRSCWANGLNHVGSICQMNTGSILAGRPSLGAWVNYGLGSENDNLPGFVVLLDNEKEPPGGNRVWGTGFMPASYQGTRFRNGKAPILHLAPPEISDLQQRRKLDFVNTLNRQHLASRGDNELEARIAAYELAFRMQAHAPEARGSLAGDEGDAGAVRPERQDHRALRPELPACAAIGRTGGAVCAALLRFGEPVGRAQQDRREPRQALPGDRQAPLPRCSRT